MPVRKYKVKPQRRSRRSVRRGSKRVSRKKNRKSKRVSRKKRRYTRKSKVLVGGSGSGGGGGGGGAKSTSVGGRTQILNDNVMTEVQSFLSLRDKQSLAKSTKQGQKVTHRDITEALRTKVAKDAANLARENEKALRTEYYNAKSMYESPNNPSYETNESFSPIERWVERYKEDRRERVERYKKWRREEKKKKKSKRKKEKKKK